MRKIFCVPFSVLLLSLLPHISLAFSEIPGLFIDEGVGTLARGGMKQLPENKETLDFNSPLFLDSNGKFRADLSYEHQRTYREYHGNMTGSHAYSGQMESAVATPYSLFAGKLAGTVAAGYAGNNYDVLAASKKEDFYISSSEHFSAIKGGFYLKALDKVSLGISLIDTDYRTRLEIPVEITVAPVDYLSIGYKRSYTDMVWNFSGLISGKAFSLPVRYAEEKNEFVINASYNKIFLAQYAQDIQHSGNNRFSGRLELPARIYFVGDYKKRLFVFNEDLSVNDLSGGYVKGEGRWREYRVGVGTEIGSHWNIEANYRRQNFDSNGGGIANSSTVLGFWPSLLVGKYNHLNSVTFATEQYQLGAEYTGENASFGMGCQYIDIKPNAELTYWRSQLFGLGKSGQNSVQLDTDRIKLMLITVGAGYRWDKFSIKFALGQFVPIEVHERSSASNPIPPGGTPEPPGGNPEPPAGNGGSSGAASGGSGSGRSVFSQIKDFINHNPGGNIVRVMASFHF